MHRKRVVALVAALCGLAFPTSAVAGGMSCTTTSHESGTTTKQVNVNDQSQHQGGQLNFSPQLGYKSDQFQANQSQLQSNAQANGNNGSQNSDSQKVLWTNDRSGTKQVNVNDQSQHQGGQFNFSPQLGYKSDQFQANQSQFQSNAQANGNNGSQNSDSQKAIWTNDRSQSSSSNGDRNGGGTKQVNANDQSQGQGGQINISPQLGYKSHQFQANQSQSQSNAQANGNNGSQNTDSQQQRWTGDSSQQTWSNSGDRNSSSGTKQVNANDQSQHQGGQINISPQLGYKSHQFQANQSQSQSNAQANGNNGSQNSGDPSGDPQGGSTKQVNASDQSQHQGGQINFSPQVGIESSQSQANQSQSQSNAQANGNNGSQNTGDPSGDPQGAGTKQINASGQDQSQGGQINISPQIGIESSQSQANQSQSQSSAQANGNNGSQNTNGS